MSGGWRIVNTMGSRLTKLKPRSGFCAETAAAISILFATEYLKLPVSTTHAISTSIMGVGAAKSFRALKWDLVEKIVWTWVLTLPAAGLLGALTFWAVSYF